MHLLKSYSQHGEDLMIDKIFKNKKNGFYIDIGANDPVALNNTKRLYDKGWSGINIEPNHDIFWKLKKERKRDINLNVGIAKQEGRLTFYKFTANVLSTFDKNQFEFNEKYGKLQASIEVPVLPLRKVFYEYVQGKLVDFINIDVEGFELEVLKSNDWEKYRPKVIIIETEHDDGSIDKFLSSVDYKYLTECKINTFYVDKHNTDKVREY